MSWSAAILDLHCATCGEIVAPLEELETRTMRFCNLDGAVSRVSVNHHHLVHEGLCAVETSGDEFFFVLGDDAQRDRWLTPARFLAHLFRDSIRGVSAQQRGDSSS